MFHGTPLFQCGTAPPGWVVIGPSDWANPPQSGGPEHPLGASGAQPPKSQVACKGCSQGALLGTDIDPSRGYNHLKSRRTRDFGHQDAVFHQGQPIVRRVMTLPPWGVNRNPSQPPGSLMKSASSPRAVDSVRARRIWGHDDFPTIGMVAQEIGLLATRHRRPLRFRKSVTMC